MSDDGFPGIKPYGSDAAPQDAEGREIRVARRRVGLASEFGLYGGRPLHEDEDAWFAYVRRLEDEVERLRDALATADPEGEPCEMCGGTRWIPRDASEQEYRAVVNLYRPCPDCCGTPDESEGPGECGACGEMIPAGVSDEEHECAVPTARVVQPGESEEHDSLCDSHLGGECDCQPDEETEESLPRPVWPTNEIMEDAVFRRPSPSSGAVPNIPLEEVDRHLEGLRKTPLWRSTGVVYLRALREKLAEAQQSARQNARIMTMEHMNADEAREKLAEANGWLARKDDVIEGLQRDHMEARAENQRLEGLLEDTARSLESDASFRAPDVLDECMRQTAARIREALEEQEETHA